MRYVWMLHVAVIVFAPPAIYAYLNRHEPSRAVKGAGLIGAAMYVGFLGPFVIGETLTDPGGWAALGLVAVWVLPMVLFSLLAWRRPDLARPVLIALVVVMAGVHLWSALAPETWQSFEDDTGPVRGVVTMALTAPLAVLAIRRVRDAGVLLLALGTMPILVALAVRVTDGPWIPLSLVVLDAPLLVIAALLLVSTRLGRSTRGRGASRGHSPTTPGRPHLTG